MKYSFFAMLAGCFVLLSSGQAATVVNVMTEITSEVEVTVISVFDSYNQTGDGMGSQVESFLRASIDGTPTTYAAEPDPTRVNRQTAQFVWGNDPHPFALTVDMVACELSLRVGTGVNQMNLSVPLMKECSFNGIAATTLINGSFLADAAVKLDITKINGEDFGLHLSNTRPEINGQNNWAILWWDKDLPQQSFTMEGTAQFVNGRSWYSSFSFYPVEVTLVHAPEPTTVGLLLGGAAVLGSLRLRRRP